MVIGCRGPSEAVYLHSVPVGRIRDQLLSVVRDPGFTSCRMPGSIGSVARKNDTSDATFMIKRDTDPLAWTSLVEQLTEAHDHLGEMIERLLVDHGSDESRFRAGMERVIAHLNQAWATRPDPQESNDEEW